ncbi:hypothetical protein N665_0025s0206 [Sinapis alba]|nr:hypothetical protein N665_0025s0206 [Sinapis alba]
MYQETQQFYHLWRLAVQERDEAREQLMHSLAELSKLRGLLSSILLSEGKIPSYYLEASDESTGHQNCSYNLFPSVRSNQMRFVVEEMRDFETVVLEVIGGVLPEIGKFMQAVSEAGSLVESLFIAGPVPKWINPPVIGNHITGNWNCVGLEFGSGLQNRCQASV